MDSVASAYIEADFGTKQDFINVTAMVRNKLLDLIRLVTKIKACTAGPDALDSHLRIMV